MSNLKKIFVLFLFAWQPLIAGPVAVVPISLLTAKADLVVVGSVQVLQSAGVAVGSVAVDRVLKGTPPGLSVGLSYSSGQILPSAPSSNRHEHQTSGYGVFFFQHRGTTWNFLPAISGDIGFEEAYLHLPRNLPPGLRETAALALSPQSAEIDRVCLELALAYEADQPG